MSPEYKRPYKPQAMTIMLKITVIQPMKPQENWIPSRKFKQRYSLRGLPFSGAEINAV